MPWLPFTADHVLARLSAREAAKYEGLSTKEPVESDPPSTPAGRTGQIVTQVLGQFRGAIRANDLVTQIGPDGTLPESCIAHAAVIGRTALITMLPIGDGETDPRRDEYRSADAFLKAIPTAPPRLFALDDAPPAGSSSSPSFGGSPFLNF